MGTRSLICVVLKGEFKVSQYSQWDGYLSEQGACIMKFISNQMDMRKFKKALNECRFLSNAEIRKTWVEAGDDPKNESGFVNMDISNVHAILSPGLSRDTGGEILSVIQDGTFTKNAKDEKGNYYRKVYNVEPVRGLQNSMEFDGAFDCEYVYVLDMDKKVLEIYGCEGKKKGKFSKMPLMEKLSFADCKKKDANKKLCVRHGEKP